MRIAKVLYNNLEAGTLSQIDNGRFRFCYDASWHNDASKPSISQRYQKESMLRIATIVRLLL